MPSDSPYDVGYRKPPRHTRFQKGQSGNPAGRPKGSLNLATLLHQALQERVTVVEQGRRTSISKLEVMLKQLVNKAAAGDLRAFSQVVFLIDQLQGSTEGSGAPDAPLQDDRQILAGLMQRMRQQARRELTTLTIPEEEREP